MKEFIFIIECCILYMLNLYQTVNLNYSKNPDVRNSLG